MLVGFKDTAGGFYQVDSAGEEDLPAWTRNLIRLTDEERLAEIADQGGIQTPVSVSMRQARLALLAAGKLDTVNAAIQAAGGAALVEWEYATEVHRDWPLVAEIGAGLDMTAAELDELFVVASQL